MNPNSDVNISTFPRNPSKDHNAFRDKVSFTTSGYILIACYS